MRKLVLVVMVLATLVSCGKSSSSPTAAGTNGITLNDATAIQLGSWIDNSANYFGTGMSSYGVSWNTLLTNPYYHATSLQYQYSSMAVSSSSVPSNNCSSGSALGGLINYGGCYNSVVSTTPTVTSVSNIVSTSIDLGTKRNELKAIINSATVGSITRINTTAYMVINASTGIRYVIDLAYPLQANPVQVQQVNGQIVTLTNII